MDGVKFVTTATADGVWKQTLPPTPASSTQHLITFSATTGETATMENVLFGDVRPHTPRGLPLLGGRYSTPLHATPRWCSMQ